MTLSFRQETARAASRDALFCSYISLSVMPGFDPDQRPQAS